MSTDKRWHDELQSNFRITNITHYNNINYCLAFHTFFKLKLNIV